MKKSLWLTASVWLVAWLAIFIAIMAAMIWITNNVPQMSLFVGIAFMIITTLLATQVKRLGAPRVFLAVLVFQGPVALTVLANSPASSWGLAIVTIQIIAMFLAWMSTGSDFLHST